ncbi:MAG: AAA family ATPase, partial [Thermoguttaceae bacterium]|nr:AAA family ATPase [Thermoguttaceae bacterium]
MLKSIELYGFKSFADRTRIELDEGICALVGPNGSGKSNVVDAIKWALGEQSAKRLRGDEMADVVFNGSASRQPLSAAEVTLSFDNRKRFLAIDADEIHLTRRVYRSGESEYLINGNASRLKDFREIVAGVGLGSQGYAVIEQGRVEALLQSSSAQRRAVLEEAAGVSRFNAKKQEVARRLERVEQNLLRLSDLVGEVESQLRKTKTQAGKAENYRLYAARLQKLRVEVALFDWRLKTAEREQTTVETTDFAEFQATAEQRIAAAETAQRDADAKLTDVEAELRRVEAELSGVRERIAAETSTVDFQSAQVDDWTAEVRRGRAQAVELGVQGVDADASSRQTETELADARAAVEQIAQEFAAETAALEKLATQAETLAAERETFRTKRQEKNAETSRFAGELAALETRRRTLEQSKMQKIRQKEEVERQIAELSAQFGVLKGNVDELDRKRETSFQRLGELKKRREELRRDLGARQVEFSELERKRTAFVERSTLLQDLLR